MASDEWYSNNRTQPDREQPWYHVLVADSDMVTYPAQSSIFPDESCGVVKHPLIPHFFSMFNDGRYTRNERPWPKQMDEP
jgi:heat shock protein HspQ